MLCCFSCGELTEAPPTGNRRGLVPAACCRPEERHLENESLNHSRSGRAWSEPVEPVAFWTTTGNDDGPLRVRPRGDRPHRPHEEARGAHPSVIGEAGSGLSCPGCKAPTARDRRACPHPEEVERGVHGEVIRSGPLLRARKRVGSFQSRPDRTLRRREACQQARRSAGEEARPTVFPGHVELPCPSAPERRIERDVRPVRSPIRSNGPKKTIPLNSARAGPTPATGRTHGSATLW